MRRILFIGLLFLICSSFVSAEEKPGLSTGIQAPDFETVNHKGEPVKLSKYYSEGPVVLIFYRGGWCYYCNLQLQDYQKHLQRFEDAGASIIVVSVDKAEKAAVTVAEKELGFEIISNPEADLLKMYNAIYQVPAELAKKYKEEYHIDLEEASGRSDRIIAVPATYVIDVSGKIVFAHSDIDYKKRKSAEEILKVIE